MQAAVELQNRSDSYETQIYYIRSLDLFFIVDYLASPSVRDWVVVSRESGAGIAIQEFYGQSFIGVARILNFYRLVQSDQQTPQNTQVYPD